MNLYRRLFLIGALNLTVVLTCLIAQGQTPAQPQESPVQGTQSTKLRGPEPKGPVPRFGIVWQGKLSRSGKPKDDDGWKWLRAQGINSIVNFRASNDVDYKSFGFTNSLWIPMDNGRLPTEAEAQHYLAWIQDPANQPVSIQCAEGKDRTGMMAALARYAIEGWSMEDAINEASLYRKGEPLSDARLAWLRDWASKNAPASQRRK
ncbi:MAG TPA: tyrosine-protein phosphatase [Pyrinomonadaceae bacterium]|nr:tyrosine-protein phosphatase [Pyrinomonadaceae bacterium]